MKKFVLVILLALSSFSFAKNSGAVKYIALDIFPLFGLGSYAQGDTFGGKILTCNDLFCVTGNVLLISSIGYGVKFLKDGITAFNVLLETGNYHEGKDVLEGFDKQYFGFLFFSGTILVTATNLFRLGWGIGRPLYYRNQKTKKKSISVAPVVTPELVGIYGKIYL